ncbi:MAG: DUF6101 family protein [Xanthobacteraceae bacterium]
MSAGSGRALRLDPFALPAVFEAGDAAADGRVREVELHRERVVVRRSVAGMRMALNLPVSAYRGVSIRVGAPGADGAIATAVVLEHCDPSLTLPLYVAPDGDEVTAEWRAWANVLGMPLLIADADGSVHEPFDRIGGVRLAKVTPRRRRRSALKRRRPRMPLRRKAGTIHDATPVHRGEREIIARN